jgi:nucleoside phosphorylase
LKSVGVGLVEASIGASRLIAEHSPDAILLVGTAGVYPEFSAELALGTAVVADKIALLPEVLPGRHAFLPAILPSSEKSSRALVHALRKFTALPCADIACPLGITATTKAAAAAGKLSGCALENLEAFAVARAAAVAKIPFAAVLGIANHVGPAGHREWKKHAKKAAAAACRAILALLEK